VLKGIHSPQILGNNSQQCVLLLDDLRKGNCRALACTILLGSNLHVPDMNTVIHRELPYNVLRFVQQSGRAGRGAGSKGYSYVIVDPRKSNLNRFTGIDCFGAQLIFDWVMNELICR
jgi:superfamily II DNA/RNA helicase